MTLAAHPFRPLFVELDLEAARRERDVEERRYLVPYWAARGYSVHPFGWEPIASCWRLITRG